MKFGLAAATIFVSSLAACSPGAPLDFRTYSIVGEISAPDGDYDYISVDPAAEQVFVGRDDGVLRLDLRTREQRLILARNGVAAVLLIPGTHLMLSTNWRDGTATLFDRSSGAVVADIPVGDGPDGAAYDAASGLAFVMNGESKDVAFVDIRSASVVARVAVGGVPEAGVVGDGRLYVNIEDRNEVAVLDISERRYAGGYALPGCHEPTGIDLDRVSGLLISACHNSVTVLTDAATGAHRGRVASGAGADGVIFDPVRRIALISAIDGTLTIFHLDRRGRVQPLQTLATREGARTAAFRSDTGAVYLPAAIVERDAQGAYLGASRDFSILEAMPSRDE